MSATDVEEIVESYLHRLDAALRALSPVRRQQLVEEVRQHIADACAAEDHLDEITIRTILDHVGAPEEIAAAAVDDPPPQKRRISRRGRIALAVAAVIVLILVGAKVVVSPATSPRTGAPTEKLPAVVHPAVRMPNLVGLEASKARAQLGTLGVATAIARATPGSGAVLVERVIAESPPAGTIVPVGSRVIISVSGVNSPAATRSTTTTTIVP